MLRCCTLLCLGPASTSSAKMLGQNHSVEWNGHVLTFFHPKCRWRDSNMQRICISFFHCKTCNTKVYIIEVKLYSDHWSCHQELRRPIWHLRVIMSKVWNLSSSLYVFLKSPLPNHKVHCYYPIFAKLTLGIWEVHITLLSPLCSNLQSLVPNLHGQIPRST